jgi:hypothetical protein
MSFTFTDNKTSAIAVIRSGKKLKYVFLTTDEKTSVEEDASIVNERLDEDTIQRLNSSFRQGMTLEQVYNLLQNSWPSLNHFTEYRLTKEEEIEVLPSPTAERVFIAGESGCGKTTQAMLYVKWYMNLFPENKVFMFLRQEDEVYESLPEHQEIIFTPPDSPDDLPKWEEDMENVITGSYGIDMFENSLVLFDDMDNVQSKKQLVAIHKLMNDIATNGRKRNIYCIYISHLLMNYALTRVMLNEANKVFFFPGCGTRQIENFLKTYGSMKTKQAESLASIKSRWVMLSRRSPRYIIHSKGMFML